MRTPSLTTLSLLAASLLAVVVTGCAPVESLFTEEAGTLSTHTCASGSVLGVAPSTPALVGCADGTFEHTPAGWKKALPAPLTAYLGPGTDRRYLLVATADGKIGRIGDGASAVTDAESIIYEPPPPEPVYIYRPAGYEEVPDKAVISFFEVSGELIAITAGAGALVSGDGGKNWGPWPYNTGFAYLDGDKPVIVHDLIISHIGDIAFLYYPEGEEEAYSRLDALLEDSETEDTAKGGGPLLVTGDITTREFEYRPVAMGRDHHLTLIPGASPGLWLFIQHPERYEMTRYVSPDWGTHLIDAGYYDLLAYDTYGTADATVLTGRTERDEDVIWLKGSDDLVRYARYALPQNDRPVRVALEAGGRPGRMVVARGDTAAVYDLSEVDGDMRLLGYYFPISFLILIVAFFAIRRALFERRLKAEYQEKARKLKEEAVHWEQNLPPAQRPPDL